MSKEILSALMITDNETVTPTVGFDETVYYLAGGVPENEPKTPERVFTHFKDTVSHLVKIETEKGGYTATDWSNLFHTTISHIAYFNDKPDYHPEILELVRLLSFIDHPDIRYVKDEAPASYTDLTLKVVNSGFPENFVNEYLSIQEGAISNV